MKYKIVKIERLHAVFPEFSKETIDEARTKKEAEELVKYYYENEDNVWIDYRYEERKNDRFI